MSVTDASRSNGTTQPVVLNPAQAAHVAGIITAQLDAKLTDAVESRDRDGDFIISTPDELDSYLAEVEAAATVHRDWLDRIAWGHPEGDVTLALTPRDWTRLVALLFDRAADGLGWVSDDEQQRDGLASVLALRENAEIAATAAAILDQLDEVTR